MLRNAISELHAYRTVTRWAIAPGLIWKSFPDSGDWVVYNPASADLHLLTASAHRLWTLVESGCSSLDLLTERLAADLNRPIDEELAAATRDAMTHMDRVGIVRPAGIE